MARANNGGWDFVKVGGVYQYKFDPGFRSEFMEVKVLKDLSTDKIYHFEVAVLKSTIEPMGGKLEFPISFWKDLPGVYSGMDQLYEEPVYIVDYKFNYNKN